AAAVAGAGVAIYELVSQGIKTQSGWFLVSKHSDGSVSACKHAAWSCGFKAVASGDECGTTVGSFHFTPNLYIWLMQLTQADSATKYAALVKSVSSALHVPTIVGQTRAQVEAMLLKPSLVTAVMKE